MQYPDDEQTPSSVRSLRPSSVPPYGLIVHVSASEASVVLAVEGELEAGTVLTFHQCCVDALQTSRSTSGIASHRKTGIIVDLSRCGYVDRQGLEALVALHIEAEEAGGILVLACPSSCTQRVLQITRLSQLLRIAATVEEAETMIAVNREGML